MALICLTTEGPDVEWKVGDKLTPMQQVTNFNRVWAIKASGDELNYIKKQYEQTVVNTLPFRVTFSIPMPDKSEVYWYGDIAKTILLNI